MSMGAIIGISAAAAALQTIVSGTVSAIGNYSSSKEQDQMLRFNERMANRNAQQENINAAAATARANAAAEAEAAEYARKEQLEREKNAKLRSYNLAVQGYSGMASDQGSSLLVNIDNAINAELDALDIRRVGENTVNNIRYEGELNAFQHRLREAEYRAEAANYNKQREAVSSKARNNNLGFSLLRTFTLDAPFSALQGAIGAAGSSGLLSKFSGGGSITKQSGNLLNMNLPKMQVTGTNKWGSMA